MTTEDYYRPMQQLADRLLGVVDLRDQEVAVEASREHADAA